MSLSKQQKCKYNKNVNICVFVVKYNKNVKYSIQQKCKYMCLCCKSKQQKCKYMCLYSESKHTKM